MAWLVARSLFMMSPNREEIAGVGHGIVTPVQQGRLPSSE